MASKNTIVGKAWAATGGAVFNHTAKSSASADDYKLSQNPFAFGLPAIPNTTTESDVVSRNTPLWSLQQRMAGNASRSMFGSQPLGDPSQAPIQTKTLLGS